MQVFALPDTLGSKVAVWNCMLCFVYIFYTTSRELYAHPTTSIRQKNKQKISYDRFNQAAWLFVRPSAGFSLWRSVGSRDRWWCHSWWRSLATSSVANITVDLVILRRYAICPKEWGGPTASVSFRRRGEFVSVSSLHSCSLTLAEFLPLSMHNYYSCPWSEGFCLGFTVGFLQLQCDPDRNVTWSHTSWEHKEGKWLL